MRRLYAPLLAVSLLLTPSVALADEVTGYVVADDYATRSDVSRLDGSVSALTGSVSSGLSEMQSDVYDVSNKVTQLVDGAKSEQDSIDAIRDSQGKALEGIASANDALGSQSQSLDNIESTVKAIANGSTKAGGSGEVEQLTTTELLALVPDDASDEIADYIQHPFIWGMAAGLFGYLLSLAISAVYRLLGFK